ncbi:MAG TPA: anthranilate synthase component I family protein [Actinomycetes bacterium]|nr:anthranilate synthase component I family protein [Actinomycetes bacterium]
MTPPSGPRAYLWNPRGVLALDGAVERVEPGAGDLCDALDRVARSPGWWAGWIAYDGHARFTRFERAATGPLRPPPAAGGGGGARPVVRASLDRAGYLAAVRAALAAIGRGDVYQVNLCVRFDLQGVPAGLAGAWWRLAAELRPRWCALLQDGGHEVACLSPERFLEVDGRRVRTSPIKGTRPRGRTPAEDRRNAAELAADPKERAENIMIVDLLRNDLGRVARLGSVRASRLLEVETYPHLHHLVSTVEAELAPGRGLGDLVAAAFPCGSVTGAPKLAAMRLIRRLEPAARGVSMGAVGWIRSTGRPAALRARLGVAIRTVELAGDRAWLCAGSGIVAQSDAAAEYDELRLKADALLRALGAGEDAG